MTESLPGLLQTFGPVVLFVMAFLETGVLIGILVPAGAALAVAVALSLEGGIALPAVVLASTSGALIGDSAGYWIGRRGANRFMRVPGWLGRTLRRYERITAHLFQRHAALSVTVGRPVAYVRTFMPITAGLNGMGYRRFLLFDVLGVAIWATLYVTLGHMGGRGWRWISEEVGTVWALGVLGVLVAAWLIWRRRRRSLVARMAGADGGGAD